MGSQPNECVIIEKEVYDEICHQIRNISSGAALFARIVERLQNLENLLNNLKTTGKKMAYTADKFKEDLKRFETDVIVLGMEKGIFGDNKLMVPVKECKLCKSKFGQLMGADFSHEEPAAIDYYGLIKKSSGFAQTIYGMPDFQVKSFRVPVIHFASIKVEQVKELAPDFEVIFDDFKKFVISIRGF